MVDDTLLVEVETESPDARDMAEGKVCISPLVVEVDLPAAPLMDKGVEMVYCVHCVAGNTLVVAAMID